MHSESLEQNLERIADNDRLLNMDVAFANKEFRVQRFRDLANSTFPDMRDEHRAALAELMRDHKKYDADIIREILLSNGALKIILDEAIHDLAACALSSTDPQSKLSRHEQLLIQLKGEIDSYINSGQLKYTSLSKFWSRLINLRSELMGLERVIESYSEEVEKAKIALRQILEGKGIFTFHIQAEELLSALGNAECTHRDTLVQKRQKLLEDIRVYLGQVKDALDFTTARNSNQIQRNTRRLNLLFIISAIASLLGLFKLEIASVMINYSLGLGAIFVSGLLATIIYLAVNKFFPE